MSTKNANIEDESSYYAERIEDALLKMKHSDRALRLHDLENWAIILSPQIVQSYDSQEDDYFNNTVFPQLQMVDQELNEKGLLGTL